MTGPDDYESVLGIPPGPRPPNHYELLGIEQSEADRERIEAAYQRRVAQAEQCGKLAPHRLRPLIQEIYQAKTCLLGEKSKADYDRHLLHRVTGSSDILLLEPPVAVPTGAASDSPPAEDAEGEFDRTDEHDHYQAEGESADFHPPEFADVSIAEIGAGRTGRSRNPRSRRLFWIITGLECVVVVAAFFYLRSRRQAQPEPPAPQFVVRPRNQPGAGNNNPPVNTPDQQPRQLARQQPERDPAARVDQPEPPSPSPDEPPADGPPNDPVMTAPAPLPTTPPPGGASPADPSPAERVPANRLPITPLPQPPPAGATPAPGTAPIFGEWMLRFPASGDWALDGDMLVLNADEKKAIAALAQQSVFTQRDTSTKKPLAVMQCDVDGYPAGIVPVRLLEDEYRAILTYNDRAISRALVFDEAGHPVWFGVWRSKSRKMLCLVDQGLPLAVQIWRGKDADTYWIDRNRAKPVAVAQADLPADKADQLASAVARLTATENLIRDSEKDFRDALKKWWKQNKSLMLKPAGREEQFRQLMEGQHAGLDKWLGQF